MKNREEGKWLRKEQLRDDSVLIFIYWAGCSRRKCVMDG